MTKSESRKLKLKPELLEKLANQTKLPKASIRVELWRIVQKYPQLTPNAAGQIYALKKKFTVMKYLEQEDKHALGNIELKKIEIPIGSKNRAKETIIKIAIYDTKDSLLR